ncbi:hypothetical protein NL676_010810 [Syzygium grande]|nr:hypothetical protein NL676_010810 [Syzygium grande]
MHDGRNGSSTADDDEQQRLAMIGALPRPGQGLKGSTTPSAHFRTTTDKVNEPARPLSPGRADTGGGLSQG